MLQFFRYNALHKTRSANFIFLWSFLDFCRFYWGYNISGGSRMFERRVGDLTELYRNIQRQNRLGDSSVPFHTFKLKRPQREGWLATQSTPPPSWMRHWTYRNIIQKTYPSPRPTSHVPVHRFSLAFFLPFPFPFTPATQASNLSKVGAPTPFTVVSVHAAVSGNARHPHVPGTSLLSSSYQFDSFLISIACTSNTNSA